MEILQELRDELTTELETLKERNAQALRIGNSSLVLILDGQITGLNLAVEALDTKMAKVTRLTAV